MKKKKRVEAGGGPVLRPQLGTTVAVLAADWHGGLRPAVAVLPASWRRLRLRLRTAVTAAARLPAVALVACQGVR